MISGPHHRAPLGAGLLSLCLAASCAPSAEPGDAAGTTALAAQQTGDAETKLPKDIARALGSDERVLDCAQGTHDGVSQFKPDWVTAESIDLNGDALPDWIVRGRHACLREGDTPAWWVYADGPGGQRVVLRSTLADALTAVDSRTGGYRDLRLRRGGEDSLVKYDGAAYAVRPDAAASSAETDPDEATLDTVAGRLQIKRLPGAQGQETFRIALQGAQLIRTGSGGEFPDFPVPRVLKRYTGIAPFDEVIVFQQNMHGNACDGGPLWILGLKRDGTYAISDPIDFCGGKSPQLSATREELKIVFPGGPLNRGEGTMPTETWRYRSGKAVRDPR